MSTAEQCVPGGNALACSLCIYVYCYNQQKEASANARETGDELFIDILEPKR